MNDIITLTVMFITAIIIIVVLIVILTPKKKEHMNNISNTSATDISNLYNSETLTVDQLTINGKLNILPKGLIAAYQGTTEDIPKGWLLCDGTNGTPNLIDKFIIGAGDKYKYGTTGGKKEYQLTINNLPAHSHTFSMVKSNVNGPVVDGVQRSALIDVNGTPTKKDYITNTFLHTNQLSGTDGIYPPSAVTTKRGGTQPFSLLPPYFKLAYIMKT